MKDGKYEKLCVGRCMMIYITALKHPIRCISLIYLKVEKVISICLAFEKMKMLFRKNSYVGNFIKEGNVWFDLLYRMTHNKWLYIEFQIGIEIYNNSFRVYGLSLEYVNAYFAAYVERFCCVIASISYKESKSHYYTICMMLLRRLSHSSYCMLIYE